MKQILLILFFVTAALTGFAREPQHMYFGWKNKQLETKISGDYQLTVGDTASSSTNVDRIVGGDGVAIMFGYSYTVSDPYYLVGEIEYGTYLGTRTFSETKRVLRADLKSNMNIVFALLGTVRLGIDIYWFLNELVFILLPFRSRRMIMIVIVNHQLIVVDRRAHHLIIIIIIIIRRDREV